MYLHLGSDTVVRSKNVIGVFDLDNTTVNNTTRTFLNTAQREGRVVNVGEELPKSFVVCREDDTTKLYISPISCQTLVKRAERRRGSAGDRN